MQSLYALQKCDEANFELAKEFIDDYFAPDLNSMEVQDKELLARNAKLAKRVFQESYQKEEIADTEGTSEEVRKAVSEAIDYHNSLVKKDHVFVKKNMLEEVNTLRYNYYLLLQLVIEFSEIVNEEAENKKKRLLESGRQVFASELNLYHNKAIQTLKNNSSLSNELIRYNVSWKDDELDVRDWYRDILKKNEQYKEYLNNASPSFEDDVEMVDTIVRQIIFKSEPIVKFMEEHDLYWAENKAALRSMLKKTIKSLEEDSEHVELIDLSANWEDDREFFKVLFELTDEHGKEYEEIIKKYARNWDTERFAMTDLIILKMALCEMINFPSIPVKVTINEYIDLSKNYSTQKSKTFVNGLLDKLSDVLQKEGKIRKSGRGLIDNK